MKNKLRCSDVPYVTSMGANALGQEHLVTEEIQSWSQKSGPNMRCAPHAKYVMYGVFMLCVIMLNVMLD